MPFSASIDYVLATVILMLVIYPFLMISMDNVMMRTVKVNSKVSLYQEANIFLDNMLLSYGSPINWYLSQNHSFSYPIAFGLAKTNASSYILSPFKTMRITPTQQVDLTGQPSGLGVVEALFYDPTTNFTCVAPNYYYVPYSFVLNNTGLENAGFKLVFTPLLEVYMLTPQVSGGNIIFPLKITNDNEPVPEASIKGFLFYLKDENASIYHKFNTSQTNYKGEAFLTFNYLPPKEYLLLVAVLSGDEANYWYYYQRDSNLSFIQTEIETSNQIKVVNNRGQNLNFTVMQVLISKDSPKAFVPSTIVENEELVSGGGETVNLTISQSYLLLAAKELSGEKEGHIYLLPFGLFAGEIKQTPQRTEYPYGGNILQSLETITAQRNIRVGDISYRVNFYFWPLSR